MSDFISKDAVDYVVKEMATKILVHVIYDLTGQDDKYYRLRSLSWQLYVPDRQ